MLKQPEMTKNGSVVKLSVTVIQYYTYSVLKYTFQATNPALGIFKQLVNTSKYHLQPMWKDISELLHCLNFLTAFLR